MADVRVDRRDAWAAVTIARADRRNALTIDVAGQLRTCLDEVGDDRNVKAIVLSGDGDVFCAGADFDMLASLVEQPPEQVAGEVYGAFQGIVKAIVHGPVPVIALVQGPALGAGCDLALCCDCRLVTERARFEETWPKLGLIPGMGGMSLLPPLVGLGRARSMLYRAAPVDTTEALRTGLADALVSHDDPWPDVERWLAPLLAVDRAALTMMKTGTRRAAMRWIDDDLLIASSQQALRLSTRETAQRISSLARK